MRARPAGLVLVTLALAGCAPKTGAVASVQAPAGVTAFREATLTTLWAREEGGGGHGFGPSTFEMGAVLLDVDGRVVVLESGFAFAPAFWEPKPMRRLVTGDWRLVASPDGRWLAVSRDGGARWRLVDPASGLSCAHLELPGSPEAVWKAAPAPEALAADVLAGGAHPGVPGAWTAHQPRLELEVAAELARAHPEDAALAASALQRLEALEDNTAGPLKGTLIAAVRGRVAADHATRERVLGWFGRAELDRVGLVTAGAAVLPEGPARTHALAGWAVRAAANPEALAEAFARTGTEWELAGVTWQLAKDAFEAGVAAPEVVEAARAWVTALAPLLKPVKAGVGEGEPEPWAGAPYAERAAVAYAVMVLGLAKDGATLSRLPARTPPFPAPWPPTFEEGPVRDHRCQDPKDPYSGGFDNVSGWVQAARAR